MKILIVDDTETVAESLELVLRHDGFSDITICNSSKRAIEIIAAVEPPHDLVMTDKDCPLPDSGLDVIDAARAKNPNGKIILMSGRLDNTVFEVENGGADALLPKPFSRQALRNVLSALSIKPAA